MKITEITCTPVHTRRQTGLVSQHVIVEIHTDSELVGIGEISDLNHEPLYMPDVDDLARTLTTLFGGQDVLDTAALETLLARSYPGNLLNGGISMAFYDIAGKALGVPVYTFFGGKYRDSIKMCYPLFRMHAPEDVEDRLETARDLLNEGYDLFRLYVAGNLDLDMAFLEQFSAEFGGRARIKSLDFSGLLTWKESVSAIERFERFDFDMVEAPPGAATPAAWPRCASASRSPSASTPRVLRTRVSTSSARRWTSSTFASIRWAAYATSKPSTSSLAFTVSRP
jgi:muconate cycloisomerase